MIFWKIFCNVLNPNVCSICMTRNELNDVSHISGDFFVIQRIFILCFYHLGRGFFFLPLYNLPFFPILQAWPMTCLYEVTLARRKQQFVLLSLKTEEILTRWIMNNNWYFELSGFTHSIKGKLAYRYMFGSRTTKTPQEKVREKGVQKGNPKPWNCQKKR